MVNKKYISERPNISGHLFIFHCRVHPSFRSITYLQLVSEEGMEGEEKKMV